MLVSDLFESIFVTDRMSAFDAMRKHPNAFTHFSKGIERDDQRSPAGAKLGVNPKKTHRDPHGIYFYYNKWLLKSEDVSDSQYAVSSDHYWICSIKKSGKSINLAKMTQDTADSIAKGNGWGQAFEEFKNSREQQSGVRIDKKLLRTVGGMFFSAMDYIANVSDAASWGQMLRGVDALYDPGKGIINSNEPAQVIVFNKALIAVLDHNDNKDKQGSIVATAMQNVARKLGGKFAFEHKVPTIRVTLDQHPLTLTSDDYGTMTVGCFKQGHWVEEQDRPEFGTWSAEAFEHSISVKLQHAVKYGKAEPSGKVSRWNKKSIRRLISAVTTRPLPIKQFVRDGVLEFTSGFSGWGQIGLFYNCSVTQNDGLIVVFDAMIMDVNREVSITFGPETSPQEIGAAIHAQLLDVINDEQKFVNKEATHKVLGLIPAA